MMDRSDDLELEFLRRRYPAYDNQVGDDHSCSPDDEVSDYPLDGPIFRPVKPKAKLKRKLKESEPRKVRQPTNKQDVLFARYTKTPNAIIFAKGLKPAEKLVLIAELTYDWDGKGCNEYSEANKAAHIGISVRQYGEYHSRLIKKGWLKQQRRGDHRTRVVSPQVSVEGNEIIDLREKK